jgi:hypothetical protein
MTEEPPKVDPDKAISPPSQEIEYALILQRMIDSMRENPAQLRKTIYEFARSRLQIESAWADQTERTRLSTALETAIRGVEDFSIRRDQVELLPPPTSMDQGGPRALSVVESPAPSDAPTLVTPLSPIKSFTPAPEDILSPSQSYSSAEVRLLLADRTNGLISTVARFCVGMLLFGGVAFLAYNKHNLPALREQLSEASVAQPAKDVTLQARLDSAAADLKGNAGSPSPSPLPFPVPTDYGIYALSNGALKELSLLTEHVPDKRISMSTPVTQTTQTTLSDGKARFIVYRRDVAGNAPERMEVRVVARVVRAMTFDPRGKPNVVPVNDTWSIRNVAYEFRVRPVAANPEMLLIQPEKADLVLPAGRYILVVRERGYDFTIAGQVTELAQCLERTDAANGEFYSECQKR